MMGTKWMLKKTCKSGVNMPCIKCSNGKWRYGNGGCVFETKKKCREAEQAIHAKSIDYVMLDDSCAPVFEDTKLAWISIDEFPDS